MAGGRAAEIAWSLLPESIRRFCATYFVGFDRDQLRFNYGLGELARLVVDPAAATRALHEEGVPFAVKAGCVSRVRLQVHLFSGPRTVNVHVDGVYILLGPSFEACPRAQCIERCRRFWEEETSRARAVLKAGAAGAGEAAASAAGLAGSDNPLQKLLAGYLPEFRLELKNVQVRFEDELTNPERPLALGMVLESLSVDTASKLWVPSDTSAVPAPAGSKVKEVNVWGVGVYCDTLAAPFVPSSLCAQTRAHRWGIFSAMGMDDLVRLFEEGVGVGHCYIVPPTSATAQVTAPSAPPARGGARKRLALYVDIHAVDLFVDEGAVRDVLNFCHCARQSRRWHWLRCSRPAARPLERRGAAARWWRYLRQYVLNARSAGPGRGIRSWLQRRADARRYIQLYKHWLGTTSVEANPVYANVPPLPQADIEWLCQHELEAASDPGAHALGSWAVAHGRLLAGAELREETRLFKANYLGCDVLPSCRRQDAAEVRPADLLDRDDRLEIWRAFYESWYSARPLDAYNVRGLDLCGDLPVLRYHEQLLQLEDSSRKPRARAPDAGEAPFPGQLSGLVAASFAVPVPAVLRDAEFVCMLRRLTASLCQEPGGMRGRTVGLQAEELTVRYCNGPHSVLARMTLLRADLRDYLYHRDLRSYTFHGDLDTSRLCEAGVPWAAFAPAGAVDHAQLQYRPQHQAPQVPGPGTGKPPEKKAAPKAAQPYKWSEVHMELALSTQYVLQLPMDLRLSCLPCPITVNLFEPSMTHSVDEWMRLWRLAYAVHRTNSMTYHCSTRADELEGRSLAQALAAAVFFTNGVVVGPKGPCRRTAYPTSPASCLRSPEQGSPGPTSSSAALESSCQSSCPLTAEAQVRQCMQHPVLRVRIKNLQEWIDLSNIDVNCYMPAVHVAIIDHWASAFPDPAHVVLSASIPAQRLALGTRDAGCRRDPEKAGRGDTPAEKLLEASIFGVEVKFRQSPQRLLLFVPWCFSQIANKAGQLKASIAELRARTRFEDLLASDDPMAYPCPEGVT